MTTIFIGGSRSLARLNDIIRSRVDNIIRQNFTIIIGDANGTDKAVQSYLASKGYKPDKSCYTVKSYEDLSSLIRKCNKDDQQRFEKEFSIQTVGGHPVLDLFPAQRG